MVLTALLSRINCQTEAYEVFIKGKAGDIVKDAGYYDIRNSIAERKAFVSGKFLKNPFCLQPDRIVISNDEKTRSDNINESDRQVVAGAVSEKGYSFADNIPCGAKSNFIFLAVFEYFSCLIVIGVIGE